MIYNDDWCLLHIPRTSGTNFKSTAMSKRGADFQMPFEMYTLKHRLSQHNTLSFFETILDKQKVYAIVRHPYRRALSLYSYAMTDTTFNSMFGNISFEDFWDVDLSDYCNWSLKTTQSQFLEGQTPVTTFKMEESLVPLYKVTGINPMGARGIINKSTRNPSRYHSEQNQKLIEHMFKEDYKQFNYEGNTA